MEAMELAGRIFERGGPIMWPLFVCSLVSLTIAVERIIYWWRYGSKRDMGALASMYEFIEKGDYEAAVSRGNDGKDSCARILVAGLMDREHGLAEAMQVEAEKELGEMKKGLPVLDTIITMAPLLGILGTVLGIIESFDLLHGSGIEDPKAVTGGIAQALITTATGLSVALITLIPFNWLVAKVQQEAKELEQIAMRCEVAYKKGGGRRAEGWGKNG